jgi:hypothetical protein
MRCNESNRDDSWTVIAIRSTRSRIVRESFGSSCEIMRGMRQILLTRLGHRVDLNTKKRKKFDEPLRLPTTMPGHELSPSSESLVGGLLGQRRHRISTLEPHELCRVAGHPRASCVRMTYVVVGE